jgi:hypothetical protein
MLIQNAICKWGMQMQNRIANPEMGNTNAERENRYPKIGNR